MKLATYHQISKLESLLAQINLTNEVNKKIGFFTSVSQILHDIDAISNFHTQLSIKLIGADTVEKLQIPTEVLKSAIDYYKNHILTSPPQIQDPKPQIPQTQHRLEFEKQKIFAENTKLKQVEELRLKRQANLIFAFLVLMLPAIGGIYFIKTVINYEAFNLTNPLTWINQQNFGQLEMLIILFEVIVLGLSKLVYSKYRGKFIHWFYETRKVKIT